MKLSLLLLVVGALLLVGNPSLGQTAPPVLGSLPPASSPTAPASAAPLPGNDYQLGRSYSVELKSGNTFIGVLRAINTQEMEFETKDLGLVHVQRASLKDLVLLTDEQSSRGYDYVGNGSRLFFAPTARSLRQGEGYVQDIDVFLLNANYGITNNFSMGVIASFVPGANNLFGITPKVSYSVSDKLHVGAGALAVFVSGYSAGVAYANATYGGADHNLTAGLGYGFSGSGGFSSTPVLMLGGATRVSRRISLLDETYLLRTKGTISTSTVVAGIAGLRVAWPRISGGLGLMYAYYSRTYNGYSNPNDNNLAGNSFPYAEVTFRFGGVR